MPTKFLFPLRVENSNSYRHCGIMLHISNHNKFVETIAMISELRPTMHNVFKSLFTKT